MVVGSGKEGGILIQKKAEWRGVGVACRFPDEVLERVEGWVRVGEILGTLVVESRVTGEEVGCRFWGTGLGEFGIEFPVLRVEESAQAGNVVGGDGVEKKVVVRRHFVFGRGSFRLLISVWRAFRVRRFSKGMLSYIVSDLKY